MRPGAAPMTPLRGDYGGRVAVVPARPLGGGAASALLWALGGAAGLVLCGRNQAQGEAVRAEIETIGARCVFVRADLSEPAACAEIVAAATRAFGRIDGLVNSAASTERGGLLDADAALFDRMMALNARAPFLTMQAAAQAMIAAGRPGSIVNVQSMNALAGGRNLTVYSASKGALSTLTRNAAHSLRQHRIRVNAINLGWADTPAEHQVQRHEHPAGDNWLAAAEATMPFGRLIKVDDVADLAAFLLSDHSGVMTGSVIDHEQWVAGAPP